MRNTLRQTLSPREHPIRFAIMMVLLGVALDRYVLPDQPDGDEGQKKGAIAKTSQERAGDAPDEPKPQGEDNGPDPSPDDGRGLTQCRKFVFRIVRGPECRDLSDEEVTDRYLARGRERLEARAESIAEELGVQNESDREKIREQVLRGCTEIGRVTAETSVSLKPPQPEECEDLALEEPLEKIWLAPEEQAAYEQLSPSEREAADLYLNKDFEGFLAEAPLASFLERIENFRREDNANPAALHLRALLRSMAELFMDVQNAYRQNDTGRVCELLKQMEALAHVEPGPPELKEQMQDLENEWVEDPQFSALVLMIEFYEEALEAAFSDAECPE